ncbi:HAD family hydrolase [Pectinatus sottacetonis]|uniref:HAD family hydrolase n=1 Tax=Pectinatus sottacetonis TaxID=1002795 RepID=UPI0018C5B68D|nr:HAD family hydrolase [Pectinatus sottacetonis]
MLYKAVIFDLDGTLINSLDDLADSVNAVLNSYKLSEYPIDSYRMMVGNGIKKLIERALPADSSENFIEEALAKFKKIYARHQLEKTIPYNGIKELLKNLHTKNIPAAVCTNKHDEAAKKIISTLFPPNTFVEIIGDLPGFKRKPDPQKVLLIAQHMGLKPEEIAYVGDSSVDMQTGVNASMLPVGVLWGFRNKNELLANGARILLKKPNEFFNKINFIS